MIGLHSLMTTSHRNSGKSKYDHKLTKLDVVATQIRYRVNGVLVIDMQGESVLDFGLRI